MKTSLERFLLLAACVSLSACSGSFNPASQPASQPASRRVGPLATVSTIVGIENGWIATISGSGSATCWTISPGLPSVAGGSLSARVKLSFNTVCEPLANLVITYTNGAVGGACKFTVQYTGTGFSYKVTQDTLTDCSTEISPNSNYDELLIYNYIPPTGKRTSQPASVSAKRSAWKLQRGSSFAKHLIWEPPTVLASNASSQTAHFNVSSACNLPPWSPTSGSIPAGSVINIAFRPNGNPCSYDSASIKATDGSILPGNECDFVVDGTSIFLVNNSNTDCTIAPDGSDTWSFVYKLIS